VRYKIIYLPSYRNRVYNVTAVIIILGGENTVTKEEKEEKSEWNKSFLKKIIKKENQINKFMKKYYNRTLILPYTSSHKVCKIKELDVVENEEEEEKVEKEQWMTKKEE